MSYLRDLEQQVREKRERKARSPPPLPLPPRSSLRPALLFIFIFLASTTLDYK